MFASVIIPEKEIKLQWVVTFYDTRNQELQMLELQKKKKKPEKKD